MVTLDVRLTGDLNRCLTELRRSYVRYIRDCQQMLVRLEGDQSLYNCLIAIGIEEAEMADRLWDFIEDAGQVPQVDNYLVDSGRFNYTTLAYYAAEILKQKAAAADLFSQATESHQNTEAGKIIHSMLTVQERHVEQLQQAMAPPAEADAEEESK